MAQERARAGVAKQVVLWQPGSHLHATLNLFQALASHHMYHVGRTCTQQ